MTYKITANNLAKRDSKAPAPALKENGENYNYRMFYNNEREIIDADTVSECLNVLIPGYENITDEEYKQNMRLNLARGVQMAARAQILSTADLDELQDWELKVLTYENPNEVNHDPYGWGEGKGEIGVYNPDQIDMWYSKVPLVLIDLNFDPYTNIRRPLSVEGNYVFVSNIIWLEPSEEYAFLKSLSRIGYVTFGTPHAVID